MNNAESTVLQSQCWLAMIKSVQYFNELRRKYIITLIKVESIDGVTMGSAE